MNRTAATELPWRADILIAMEILLDHRRQARRRTSLLGLGVSLALMVVAPRIGSPAVVVILAAFCFAGFAALIVARRPAGSRIDRTAWTCFHGAQTRVMPLADIAAVQLISWPDGPDTARVEMHDGRILTVPQPCLPESDRLDATLTRLGVPVRRD